jgi:sulfite reductase beta subunit-like hemoprotein
MKTGSSLYLRSTLLFMEHDPLLYEDSQEMAELADRVFCIYNEPAAAKDRGKAEAKTTEEQRTLEALEVAMEAASKKGGARDMELEMARRSWRRSSTPSPTRWRR